MPIGKDRDWESYNNYFFFINGDSDWMPLDRAMKDYRNFCQHFYRSGYEVQPKLFPLVSFEECTWAIIGNEIQQATSPVFRFYDDERPEKIYFGNSELIVWNSLAEMFADDLSDAANWYRDKV
ncbi:hypothetical protein [Anabaena cylindrica]|uniref:hypothetical protein n=1 Tax=Anabaena cylindrica TaxID=1165 RepID=UPI0005A8A56C|nr:hypothetical protein [Anabaena cylindrica]